ncbi:hypothetical protein IBE48_09450 [Francisella philomiragia]|uniref:hypothetical protein n=1 Tax=Francisella philomiragia TaxID=28110 RepID=UPI0012D32214|nr:hypothetical protein [Francisella philomiragia]MBK2255674.1 hypothetical protein [Francisella philomiragia]MBK2273987.1 hypothetical protein [Francisella philomiragia]MBK2277828.1 hypothetical protein [Francisella philomiragia]MBK2281774.1 hypothetical protein [Francisella philomiragia]MBK2283724.1 hypothetical protein [Francisella philomiragia]
MSEPSMGADALPDIGSLPTCCSCGADHGFIASTSYGVVGFWATTMVLNSPRCVSGVSSIGTGLFSCHVHMCLVIIKTTDKFT